MSDLEQQVTAEVTVASRRLFDWFTPAHNHHAFLFTPAICVLCWTVTLYMAGSECGGGPGAAVRAWQCSFRADYLVAWGARSNVLLAAQPWRWLTSAWVHAGFWHVLANTALFWLLGHEVERRYGLVRMMALWALSSAGGALLSALVENGCVVVTGLSASVFGLLGLFVVDLAKHWNTVGFPLLKLGALSCLLVLLAATVATQSQPVSHASHAGGLVTGLLPALLFQRTLFSAEHPVVPVWLRAHHVQWMEQALPAFVAACLGTYFLTGYLVFYLRILPALQGVCL